MNAETAKKCILTALMKYAVHVKDKCPKEAGEEALRILEAVIGDEQQRSLRFAREIVYLERELQFNEESG